MTMESMGCWGSCYTSCRISTPPMTNSQEERHIVKSALEKPYNHIKDHRKVIIFAALPVSCCKVRWSALQGQCLLKLSCYASNVKKFLPAALEFDAGRIVAYREPELSLRDIVHLTRQQSIIVMQIWNQWVAEDYSERYAGSQHPSMTNFWEDRYTVK